MRLIFVYGTLMRGHSNHRFLKDSEFVGIADTSPNYNLFEAGIPFMTEGKYSVRGELFRVDDFTLEDLDRLEGHPNFYRRTPIQIPGLAEPVEAYLSGYLGARQVETFTDDGVLLWSQGGRDAQR